MSFHIRNGKGAHGGSGDSFWTSYSDLFLGLSTIFLLLYVTSSLRSGTDAIQGQIENRKLTMQVEELQGQLKMYEGIKNEYMQNQASQSEVQEYTELMDKLTLLQEEAKTEKDRLTREALENEKKGAALNKYQQMVRNIINANKTAKTKIATRNDFIQEQDVQIDTQKTDIANLQQDVVQKKKLIEQNENKIAQTEAALNQKLKELKHQYKQNKLTKKSFESKTKALQAENEAKLNQMKGLQAQYSAQLAEANGRLDEVSGKLAQTQSELGHAQGELTKTKGALGAARGELTKTKGALGEAQGELSKTKGALGATQGELEKTKSDLGMTKGELAKAKEEIDARKGIAREIKKGFAAAGIKAEVDMSTGEVILDFGQTYFENDSSHLKPEMKAVIEKAMPVYSQSLFGNPKVAGKISAVEIIGFASPTYKGRFVNPHSDSPEDKAALKYNMDLSYRRAKSIFDYLLSSNKGNVANQKKLMALMKVSGRSFLESMNIPNRDIAMAGDFCKVNDCRKAQRVIVRFGMDGKK